MSPRVSPGFPFADSAPRQELDAGFEFIETHSPRATGGLEQLRWSTKQLAEKTSPMRGWPVGLAQKALRAITTEGVLVKKEHAWFITLTPQHYEPWFISMLEHEHASEARRHYRPIALGEVCPQFGCRQGIMGVGRAHEEACAHSSL